MGSIRKIFDLDRWVEIFDTLTRNKMRSVMTAMGVFWSISILVILLGASGALKQYVWRNMPVAQNTTFMFSSSTSQPYKGFPIGRYWTFQDEDLERVAQSVDGVKIITPIWSGEKSETLLYGNKEYPAQVIGRTPETQKISSVRILQGRYVNDIDMLQGRKVAILGSTIYDTFFPNGGEVEGKSVILGGDTYTIIGVMERMSDMVNVGNGNVEESIYIPYTTMQKRYNLGGKVYGIGVLVDEKYDVEQVQEELASKFRSLYNISPDDAKAVNVFNMMEFFLMFKTLLLGLDILIWIVGLGTLIAGVIGISNIMLIVLKERTQEIGVRRALGATPGDIISQILTESFILTFVSGVFALGFSVGLLSVVDSALQSQGISAQVGFETAVFSAAIIIIGGLLAGVIPASRAVAIRAVDAIREE